MKRKGKIRWGALVNAAVGVLAVLADPSTLDLAGKVGIAVPEQLTHGVALATLLIAAVKKAVVRDDSERE